MKVAQSNLLANAADEGGGIYTDPFDLGSVNVTQSLFVGNTGVISGGAIYIGTNSNFTIRDSTITGNTAASGGGINESSSSGLNLNVRNTIVALNTSVDAFPDVHAVQCLSVKAQPVWSRLRRNRNSKWTEWPHCRHADDAD